MKRDLLTTTLFISLSLLYGCSSNSDSTEKAEKLNNERIDKQAVAVSNDAKEDAKTVSGKMVELANTSMTEYELSKVAVTKATNPEVKSYARQAMNDHQQDDKTLQSLAKQLNITLPAGLSNKSQSHLGKLTEMRAGTEFDTQYLDYMAEINDEGLDAADDLEDDAPSDAVKSFAKKHRESDKKHRDQAKQMKNALN